MNEFYLRHLGVQTVLGGEFEDGLAALAQRLARGVEAAPGEQLEPRVSLACQDFVIPDREGLPSLDRYAYLRLPNGDRRTAGYVEASRGCKHRCRHCPVVPVYNGRFHIFPREWLAMGPELAVADGALGFWQAVEEVWPRTRGQRCWVHKTANVLNKLPKSQQSKAKRALQEIWMAETKKDALAAFDAFIETWGVKYDKAVECLIKDRDALLAFYDFPAEHWKHLRTTNPIESSFATVRHRTVRSKGCLSNKTALAMIFKLAGHVDGRHAAIGL